LVLQIRFFELGYEVERKVADYVDV
jgi:hypothetical protein